MPSPLEKYDTENESRWEILQDVPEWEKGRILKWIKSVVSLREPTQFHGTYKMPYNPDVMQSIQRKERIMLREELGVSIRTWIELEASLTVLLNKNPERFILVLELVVKYVRDNADSRGNIQSSQGQESSKFLLDVLDIILANGSKWKVVREKGARSGLAERANEELTDTAKKLDNKDLSDAWNLVYGAKTDAKLAVEKAQNAVEYFAHKSGLITKTNKYGNLLGDVKNNLDKYVSSAAQQYLEFDKEHNGEHPDGTLNDMMSTWFWQTLELIQKTNSKRHVNTENNDKEIPIESARQAVLMATLICEMIDKSYFKKSKPAKKGKE